MKIKLSNQQSRRRIQQLNSRLKLLASDVHGEEKYKVSNVSQISSGLGSRLRKKNYFNSATNLNTYQHQNDELVTSGMNDYLQDNQPITPSSPKFFTSSNFHPKQHTFSKPHLPNSPKLFSSSSNTNLASTKTLPHVKKQLKQIIQSKKQFHSLIKKELSELQMLEQMMIEQPEGWEDQEVKRNQDGYKGFRFGQMGKQAKNGVLEKDYQIKEYQRKPIHQAQSSLGQQLSKTKTQQSMQQQMSDHTLQQPSHLPSNQTSQNLSIKPQSPKHQLQSSCKQQQFQQQSDIRNIKNPTLSQFNQQKQSSSIRFNRKQAQELIKEMMIMEYSQENIQSILKLVQEQSIRRSKRNSLQNKMKNSPSESKFVSENPSIISRSSAGTLSINNNKNNNNSSHQQDHIKQNQQQQQKHYQLIHSYKLLSLCLKMKNFSQLKSRLAQNLFMQHQLHQAQHHYTTKLLSKTLTALLNHTQQSLQQQTMLYKIKTIYMHKMLKKTSLKQMLFNVKYKNFKFLSAKLMYKQQLKTKSYALAKMLAYRHQKVKQDQISKLSEQMNKKSMFKMVKEKYLSTRETHAKYKLLKNLVKHRNWNGFVRVVRFDWVRKIVRGREYEDMEADRGIRGNSNNKQYSNSLDYENKMSISIQSSSSIQEKIIYGLNSYTQLFTSYMSQLKNSSLNYSQPDQSSFDQHQLTSSVEQSQTIMEFSEPIVLYLKKEILEKYLQQKRVKDMVGMFVEGARRGVEDSRREQQVQKKEGEVVERIVLRNKKVKLLQKLKENLLSNKQNQKLSYFCNMTIGKVPLSINFSSNTQNQSSQIKRQSNPFMLKYYKHLFICKMKDYLLRQDKRKLQKQVYYDTIYGRNLIKIALKYWKSAIELIKVQKRQQQELRNQTLRVQEKLHNQRIQQQKAYKQLTKQQEQLRQQQSLLKQHQLQLKRAQSVLHKQQNLLSIRQQQIKTKLAKLQKQQQELSRIEKVKIEKLKEEAEKLQRQKERLYQEAEKKRERLMKEEMEMRERVERLREEEKKVREEMLKEVEIENRRGEKMNQTQRSDIRVTIQQHSSQQNQQQQANLQSDNEQKHESNLLDKSQTQHYLVEQSMVSQEESTSSQQLTKKSQESIQNSLNSIPNQSISQIELEQYKIQQQKSFQLQEQADKDVQDRHLQGSNCQQNYSEEEEDNQPHYENQSQQSQQILAQYLTQRSKLPKNQSPYQQQSTHKQQSPHQQQQADQDHSALHEQSSSLKVDDMMDWLGNKIGIKSPTIDYIVEESQQFFQQQKDQVQEEQTGKNKQQAEQDLEDEDKEQQDDEIFVNMLKPHQQPTKNGKRYLKNSQVNQSAISSHLNESKISINSQSSPKSPSSPHLPQPKQYDLLHQQYVEQTQSEPQQSYEQSSANNSQPQQQSQSQQQQQNQFACSTSQSHLRLLTYAQNHRNKQILHLIFQKVFKQKLYLQQQSRERNLLTTVFIKWKSFYVQKKSLKKYLDIYEQIDARVNGVQNEGDQNKSKREARSLERGRQNQSAKRYMSNEKTNTGLRKADKAITYEQDKARTNPAKQGISYYPTSKQQKQQFQNLYK